MPLLFYFYDMYEDLSCSPPLNINLLKPKTICFICCFNSTELMPEELLTQVNTTECLPVSTVNSLKVALNCNS